MVKKPKDVNEAFVIKQESMQKRFTEKDRGLAFGNAMTGAFNLVANHSLYADIKDETTLLNAIKRVQKDIFDYAMDRQMEMKEETTQLIPFCKECGAEMKERSGKNGTFWGCSRYPKCKYTFQNPTVLDFKSQKEQDEADDIPVIEENDEIDKHFVLE